ncbi:G-type lectin S-receptor-like serine/threonine-protein kinase [Dichanthelium oligosanthes]|uniref:Receptor-like serine/threonine-protein kinase n=1 Tax=Dichanthelium oligosanthes TaxID=888268 RepID=A0A1E5VWU8_9POAL|nr:G-type lectin S-receptor-like serine/threonine-protein kinase [Dichanthelium oligosanthes]
MRPLLLVLCGLLLSHHTPLYSLATDTLSRGRSFAGDERLVSGNGKFALGFFPMGTSNSSSNLLNWYLGIWFNKVPKLTPVWTANRDHPISAPASPELIVDGDGNLVVLAQGTSTIIWSTRGRANITANDTVALLLDSGNLVLRSSSNSSRTFWESFDYPTDTMLPGAKIGWNKVTGLNRYTVSRKNSIDLSSGLYSSKMDLDGVGRMSWNSSAVYWSSGKWNGRFFSSIPEMSAGSSLANFTLVNNDQEVYFTYTILSENAITINVLDVNGQMQLRAWAGQDWFTINSQPRYQCDVYAVCGPFTVCTSNADPFCNCMKGFSARSPGDWEIENRRDGCIRNTPLNCGGDDGNKTGMTDKFYSMPGIRLPQNGTSIPNASSANECAQVCLRNCSCTAYTYGKDGCSIWHDELLNVATDDNGEMIYLRLAAKELESRKGNKNRIIIGVAIGASITTLAGFVFLVVIWRRRNKKWSSRKTDNDQDGVGIIAFRYVDLQYATKKFSEKLGTGGFGSVFKGWLSDSVAIAVKRLDGAQQGEKQFRAEVNSIGIIQHINLVKLIGFCCEGDRRLLVYEHMPNGSLDSHIFQSHGAILNWTIRYQIALGVARGLGYLHHGCRYCIIHCDIKPQNILLDTSFVPKIADFGMAKFLGRDFSRVLTTMRGTIGYLAPEWISGTAVTSKVDVYSYGMVLLEIISGKRNSPKHSSSDEDRADYYPVQVAHKLLDGDILSLVDANLHGDVNTEEVERVCKVACWCIQDSEFDRPTMAEVVQFLEGICEPEMPPVPRLLDAIAGGTPTTGL